MDIIITEFVSCFRDVELVDGVKCKPRSVFVMNNFGDIFQLRRTLL